MSLATPMISGGGDEEMLAYHEAEDDLAIDNARDSLSHKPVSNGFKRSAPSNKYDVSGGSGPYAARSQFGYFFGQGFSSAMSAGVTSIFGVIQIFLMLVIVILVAIVLAEQVYTKDDVSSIKSDQTSLGPTLSSDFKSLNDLNDGMKSQLTDLQNKVLQVSNDLNSLSSTVDLELSRIHELEGFIRAVTDFKLPHHFLVDARYLTPIKNQQQRGTCWDFSTLAMLEGMYRYNGVLKGFLDESTVIQFSEQAYGERVALFCSSTSPSDPNIAKMCEMGGPLMNSTEGGYPEWIYMMQDHLKKAIVGHSVCPYQPTTSGTFDCPNYYDATNPSKNPMDFKVNSIMYSSEITEMKRQIASLKTPATWVSMIVKQTVLFPCSTPGSLSPEADAACLACLDKCDDGTGTLVCCFPYGFMGINGRGEFFVHGTASADGGHAQLLVGYNDDMIVNKEPLHTKLDRIDPDAHSTGGFVLKNSWGYNLGHTPDYWSGNWTLNQEQQLCPNMENPENWHVLDKYYAYADKPAGSVPWSTIAGDSPVTFLECKGAGTAQFCAMGFCGDACSDDYYYALISEPGAEGYHWVVPGGTSGTYKVNMISIERAGNSFIDPINHNTPAPTNLAGVMKYIESNETIWGIYWQLFSPVGHVWNGMAVDIEMNTAEYCGYFFMTYDLVREAAIRFGLNWSTHYSIDFDDCSYPSQKSQPKCGGKDYKYLETSQVDFPTYHWSDGAGIFNKTSAVY